MRLHRFGLSLLLLAGTLCAASPTRKDGLIVHEWGTFLAMNDSDGVTLDGMYHEEHALPGFVHSRQKDQLRLPSVDLKGETPVIYFYTDREQEVCVNVRFPQGIWTQWYPQAAKVAPQLTQVGSHLEPQHGRIEWRARLLPAGARTATPRLPKTDPEALWNYARDVDAAYVQTTDETTGKRRIETERYLFYRGLGRAELPLRVRSSEGGTLALDPGSETGVSHLFVVRVEKGKGAYRYLPELRPGDRRTQVLPEWSEAKPIEAFTKQISDDMVSQLTDCGLYEKEARAMVNTWRTSYFESDGVRVLYVLPQSWTERFIPMKLDPKPRELVRVMVGRTELLLPEREREVENSLRELTSQETTVRERAFKTLRAQGRYIEPILRRTLQKTQDEKVRSLCRRLLLTDFVRDLRASLNSPTTGAKMEEDAVYVRAQLASVLYEAGLKDDARKQAEIALATLRGRGEPALEDHESRHPLRAYARAVEGLGDLKQTADRYERLVTFGSQVKNGCAGCHADYLAPRTMDWFRDWYAGRKFAAYTAQLGLTDAAIQRCKSTLAKRPNDTAAQMLLAYLYEATHHTREAETLWARLTDNPNASKRRRTASR